MEDMRYQNQVLDYWWGWRWRRREERKGKRQLLFLLGEINQINVMVNLGVELYCW